MYKSNEQIRSMAEASIIPRLAEELHQHRIDLRISLEIGYSAIKELQSNCGFIKEQYPFAKDCIASVTDQIEDQNGREIQQLGITTAVANILLDK